MVIVAGLPGTISVPAVSSPSPVAVLPPSPPTSKSAGTSIGAVAGGIAGGAVCIGKHTSLPLRESCTTCTDLSLFLLSYGLAIQQKQHHKTQNGHSCTACSLQKMDSSMLFPVTCLLLSVTHADVKPSSVSARILYLFIQACSIALQLCLCLQLTLTYRCSWRLFVGVLYMQTPQSTQQVDEGPGNRQGRLC